MNKQCFRVIFSKSQQQFVVVSELAKSSGKSSTAPKAKIDDLFSLLFENLVCKENSQSETWQNNQLQAGKLVTNSANSKLTLDATNVKAKRWEGEVQDFESISRQDITTYNSEQVQAGGSVAANDIVLDANRITLTGTQGMALNNITVTAKEGLLLDAAVNQHDELAWASTKKSGVTASAQKGVASVGIGKQKAQTHENRAGESLLPDSVRLPDACFVVNLSLVFGTSGILVPAINFLKW